MEIFINGVCYRYATFLEIKCGAAFWSGNCYLIKVEKNEKN